MNIEEIIKPEWCTGCTSCNSVCPVQAIKMKKNCLAEKVPVVNKSICVDCGKCISICPAINNLQTNNPMECLAACSLDLEDKKYSASGGMASVISRKIINHGGIVCGVVWNDKMEAVHEFAYDAAGLKKFKGSKYVESHLGNVTEIINVLKDGKLLLYIGTPCQVAAIKRLTKGYQDNLVTIDLICHGMPPIDYFKEHISKRRSKITDAKFRGEKDFWLRLYRDEKCVYESFNWYDEYFSAFMENLIFRESCYSCKYATSERVGDFSLGDFWGLSDESKLASCTGRKSLVLINTKKGKEIFNCIADDCIFEVRSLEEAKKENRQLNSPSLPSEDRNVFLENYPKYGFNKAIKKTVVYKNVLSKRRWNMKSRIKQKLLGIWRLK